MAFLITPQDCIEIQDWIAELEDSTKAGQADLQRLALLRRVLLAAEQPGTPGSARWARQSRPNGASRPTSRATSLGTMPSRLTSAAEPADDPDLCGEDGSGQFVRVSEQIEFCADPAILTVRRGFLLQTQLGVYLKRKQLLNWIMLGLGIIVFVAHFFQPWSTQVPVDGPLLHTSEFCILQRLRMSRPGLFCWLSRGLASVTLWVLMCHSINRELFWTALYTFDAFILIASAAISVGASMYNMLNAWYKEGYYDATWLVFDVLDGLAVVLPSSILISGLDSWRVVAWVDGDRRSVVKIVLAVMGTAYFLVEYLNAHLMTEESKWDDIPKCVGRFCVTSRELFKAAQLQRVIFLGKITVKYLAGWPFAFIRPWYNRHDALHGRKMLSVLLQTRNLNMQREMREEIWNLTWLGRVNFFHHSEEVLPVLRQSATAPCPDCESASVEEAKKSTLTARDLD